MKKNKKIKIMGLDVSTSTIGYSILYLDGYEIELKVVDYFKPPKKNNVFEMLSSVKTFINERIDCYKPDEIVVEDFLKYMQGKTGAQTIIALATINRMVGLTIYEATGKAPHLINASTARKIIKPKDHSGRLSKEDIPATIEKILEINFPYVFNRNGLPRLENFDMADSIAVSLAWISSNFSIDLRK